MTAQVRGDAQDLLLAGARSCLRRLGYRRTTARAIAAESGANLRSIGYHYGSVRALALLALSRNFREWLAPLVAPADEAGAAEAITRGLAAFTTSYEENAGLVSAWLQAVGDARDDAELRATLAANQHGFRDAFAANLAAAGVSAPTEAAEAIITICDGLMIRHLLHGAAPSPQAIVEQAREPLSGACRRPSGPARGSARSPAGRG